MSPWTPLAPPYSRTESHCWWGHYSRPEGGSQFIRAAYQGLREERGIESCGDSKLLNSPPHLPKRVGDFAERSQRCSGETEKSPGKMAPASLVFTWLLVTLRTVTWAEYLEPEEDGEFTP